MRIEDIPEKLKNFNFVIIGDEKRPIQRGWTKKVIKYDNSELKTHLKAGGNYGVQSNNSMVVIDGKNYFLLIIDFDKKEFQDKVLGEFPKTFTTTSGSPKNCNHIWLASDNNKAFRIKDEKGDTLTDIIGAGIQVIAPGSKHSSGSIYSVVEDLPIAFMPYTQIEAILKPHDETPKKKVKVQKPFIPKGTSNDVGERAYNSISMEDVLGELNIDTSKNPTNCFESSCTLPKCLSWNDEVAHCFDCGGSWNKFSLIRDGKNLTNKETYDWFAEKSGLTEELKKSREEYVKKEGEEEYDQINEYIWDEEKLIQKKSFPMDLHKDIFYFGLLLPRNALEKDKKGNVLGMRQDLFNVLITKKDKPKLIQYSKRVKEDLGLSFTSFPSYLPHRWKLDKIKKFLDGETKLVDGKELLDKIFKQYKKYLYIRNPTWYKIHSIWDIGSYLYQLFEAYPLFELRGIADTGKSKSMGISSYISFNGGQLMVNPSESTLFRETEEVRGAKYFDEAEKLWIYNKSTKQYEGDVRTELINASYTKEAKVPRQEKVGNKFITKWYSPYSPTQLSSINGLYGATETRAITRITTKSPNEDKRGEIDPAEDRNNDIWNEVRDECYRFALENWKELKEMYNEFPKDCGLKRRDYQIWKPILTISKFISEETYEEILKFAIEMTKRKTEDLIHESSFDYFCLSAMKEVLETNPEYNKVYINSIKIAYCNAKGDEEGRKDIYLNRNISNHLDKLGFKEFRDRDNKLAFFAITKEIFNEIVSPICPNIVFLSPPSPPSPLNDKLNIKNNKRSVDEVVIGVDSKNKNKKKVVMSGENGDNGDTWRLEDKNKNKKKDEWINDMIKLGHNKEDLGGYLD